MFNQKVEQEIIRYGGTKKFLDHECVPLNESYYHEPTPKKFKKGVHLFAHQMSILSAMLDVENRREYRDELNVYRTSAGLLSEKFGSGKTFMILALIMKSPMPENKPVYQQVQIKPGFGSITIKKTFDSKMILRPAIIFVASSVLLQWEHTIKSMTTLKVFAVTNIFKLNDLWRMTQEGSINNYDVILVKNGVITGKLKYNGQLSSKNERKQKKIFNVCSDMFAPYCFSRIIIDDFDIIGLPEPAGFINALFTWFVSASKFSFKNSRNDKNDMCDIYKSLMYSNLSIKSIWKNNSLNKYFNVRNEIQYVEDSVNVGKPVFLIHTFVNKNSRYIDMIGQLAGDNAAEIMEMLNGDAIETAAEKAGIKTSSVTDIFKKVLQDKYDDYEKATSTISFIDTINIDELETLPDPEEKDFYHQKHVYMHRPIHYNFPAIVFKVCAVKDDCIVLKKQSEIAITRVKDNLREGECPVCYNEFEGDDIIIMGCCGKVLCAICGKEGSHFRRCGNAINGKCPNCRNMIGFNELIFIDGEMNLENIINEVDDGEEVKEIKEEKEKDPDVPDIPEEEYNDLKDLENYPKMKRLVQIIKNYPFRENKPTISEPNIEGMIIGNKDLPDATQEEKKIVIFSRFDEGLDSVGSILEKRNIKYKRLGGTTNQIHDLAVEFQSLEGKNKILLINGEKYASGLNLQSMSDLVFTHKIANKSVEAQIIGRGQRVGRKNKLFVHYLKYSEEV